MHPRSILRSIRCSFWYRSIPIHSFYFYLCESDSTGNYASFYFLFFRGDGKDFRGGIGGKFCIVSRTGQGWDRDCLITNWLVDQFCHRGNSFYRKDHQEGGTVDLASLDPGGCIGYQDLDIGGDDLGVWSGDRRSIGGRSAGYTGRGAGDTSRINQGVGIGSGGMIQGALACYHSLDTGLLCENNLFSRIKRSLSGGPLAYHSRDVDRQESLTLEKIDKSTAIDSDIPTIQSITDLENALFGVPLWGTRPGGDLKNQKKAQKNSEPGLAHQGSRRVSQDSLGRQGPQK